LYLLVVAYGLLFTAGVSAFRITGFCAVPYPYDFSSSQFNESFQTMLRATSPGWMAVVEDWGQPNINSTTIGPAAFSQNTSNLVVAIRLAKAAGLRVALKPHVDLTNDSTHWRGEIGMYFTPSQWQQWFASYTNYMLNMSALAAAEDVDLLIIGTELTATEAQTSLWLSVISSVRNHSAFRGQLVYGANHPTNQFSSWWSALDYIGLDAYYPLTLMSNPTVAQIEAGWQGLIPYFEKLHSTFGKQILFNEMGYQSLSDTTVTPWSAHGNLSLSTQANAFQAYFSAISGQSWFAGAFFWAWSSDPSQGGPQDTGFAVQGKPAEQVIANAFRQV
jgi:hypothetical protein